VYNVPIQTWTAILRFVYREWGLRQTVVGNR
jgi:hypothetical protein